MAAKHRTHDHTVDECQIVVQIYTIRDTNNSILATTTQFGYVILAMCDVLQDIDVSDLHWQRETILYTCGYIDQHLDTKPRWTIEDLMNMLGLGKVDVWVPEWPKGSGCNPDGNHY